MMVAGKTLPVGQLLRNWRERRRLSQLALACEAEISSRHLSFLETGRSQPSREMVLHLAEQLEVPLRERNALLIAAGYAPEFANLPLDDPALRSARKAVELVLAGHEPYPALAIDRHWTLIGANKAVAPLLAGVDASLLKPPVNVLRLSLHPLGLALRIANLAEWRAHLLKRLHHQIETTADAVLEQLRNEICGYAVPDEIDAGLAAIDSDCAGVFVPLQIVTERGTLSFISTTTVFGTPIEITLSELAIEAFLPADGATARSLRHQSLGAAN